MRARVRFIIAFFVGDLDDDDLQKTTKIEKKISNKKTQERRRERKKEEKKSEDTYIKQSFFVSSSSSFAKFVFLKRGVVCALQVLLLRSIFFLESHQGNVETR